MPSQETNSSASTVNRQMEQVAVSAEENNGAAATPSANPRRRLRIRFANRTKVYLVPTIGEYTEEEFVSTWTTDEDTKANQAGLVRDINALRNGAADGEHGACCPRGLENMRSAAHMERRKINKAAVADAVFEVQDVQFEADVYDEEEIRRASVRHSMWARDNAEVMAGADAAYVRLHVRGEVDAFLREHYRQQRAAKEQGGVGGKDGDDNDHLTLLQSALELSDSEDSTGSASAGNSGRRSRLFSPASPLNPPSSTTTTMNNKNNNGSNAPLASASLTGVDMFLNRISSRFNHPAGVPGGPNKLLSAQQTGASARMSVQSVTRQCGAATGSNALNGNAAS